MALLSSLMLNDADFPRGGAGRGGGILAGRLNLLSGQGTSGTKNAFGCCVLFFFSV